MGIRSKLMLSFGTVCAIALIIGIIGYWGMQEVMRNLDEMEIIRIPDIKNYLILKETQTAINMEENILASPKLDAAEREGIYESLEAIWKRADAAIDYLANAHMEEEEKELWKEFIPAWEKWKSNHEKFIDLSKQLDESRILNPMELRYELALRQKDHALWIWQLSRAIAEDIEFQGETDPKKCALGRWLSSFTTENEDLAAAIEEIHKYHDTVHQSGDEIRSILSSSDPNRQELATQVYQQVTIPAMGKVMELFGKMDDIAKQADDIYEQLAGQAVHINSELFRQAESLLNRLVEKNDEIVFAMGRKADKAARFAASFLIISILSGIGLSVALAFILSQRITRSVKEMQELMKEAEKGNLTVRGAIRSKDEIGQLTASFNHFIENIRAMTMEIFETTEALSDASVALVRISENLASNSEEMSAKTGLITASVEEISVTINNTAEATVETSQSISSIASAVEEMSATTRNLASASEQTSINVEEASKLVTEISSSINRLAGSAAEVSESVSSVATSVKELNLSLNEVNSNCERSTVITRKAEERARETDTIIKKLNDSAKQISKIVDVINDIADQTNMLALNAAIEAAGAGEAGKGFAVVANEVKELAKQTAEATEEIAVQISEMQSHMNSAVEAVSTITRIIEETTDITNTIASAVTEQSAITGEISETILEAAKQVNMISSSIGDIGDHSKNVALNVSEASKGVQEIARSAHELSRASNEIAHNTEMASHRMEDVARSTNEISIGANEINQNIQEISAATEDTASGASETSAAASQLSDLANKLEKLVKQFKI